MDESNQKESALKCPSGTKMSQWHRSDSSKVSNFNNPPFFVSSFVYTADSIRFQPSNNSALIDH
jgi:hypothetical protein